MHIQPLEHELDLGSFSIPRGYRPLDTDHTLKWATKPSEERGIMGRCSELGFFNRLFGIFSFVAWVMVHQRRALFI